LAGGGKFGAKGKGRPTEKQTKELTNKLKLKRK
jgi:hypothetical protein